MCALLSSEPARDLANPNTQLLPMPKLLLWLSWGRSSQLHPAHARSVHPVDWNDQTHELAQREPRRGRRLSLAAVVHPPQRPPLLVYCVHLEARAYPLHASSH